jgi:peptide/nickel transport system permease protein
MNNFYIQLRNQPFYFLSFIILCTFIILAMLGAVYTPQDPIALNVDQRLQAPSIMHWLGTDQFGRDLFSRMLAGAAVSFKVSFCVVGLALFIGVPLGAAAGYFQGVFDRVVSAIADALLALPGILLALTFVSIFGGSESGVILALGLAYTPYILRVVRSKAISLKQTGFVETSRLLGRSHIYILSRHIAPNIIGPITVLATSYFAQALLSESALSFLGLGMPPPYPSWGGILSEARPFMYDAPWLSIVPGIAITISLLSINLVGDALRDYFDPRNESKR